MYRLKILAQVYIFNNALRSSSRYFCFVFEVPRFRISSWGLIIIAEILPWFLSPFSKMLGQYLKADHEHFLLRIYDIIIQLCRLIIKNQIHTKHNTITSARKIYSIRIHVSVKYFEHHQAETKCKFHRHFPFVLALRVCPMMVKIIDRNMLRDGINLSVQKL